jgi:tripeptidyl-peptidase-1
MAAFPFSAADPYSGGYKGNETCGGYTPTKVISTSYDYNEADLSYAYEKRQCTEFAKFGLLGTTFVYSSGDYGVAGNSDQCIDPDTGDYNNGSSGLFNPSFPSTCPYVLSVGATQINPGSTVADAESACSQVIYSGGGFSNNFPLPSYQKSALKTYFKKHKPSYGSDRYNNSQATRGYPDVSANGAGYVVATGGEYELVYGTSASAPTFAAIIAMINEKRLNAGKSSVGFVNTAFYANPSMFNDITSGTNPGCGTDGFTAVSDRAEVDD